MKKTKEITAIIEKESKQTNTSFSTTKDQQLNPDLLDPEKSLWKPLFFFFLPLVASNALQSLSGFISSIVVGQGLGESELATVNIVMPLIFFLHSFIIGIGGACSVLIGQAFGANDKEQIRSIVNTSLKFAFFLGLFLTIIGIFFAENLLTLIQTPASILKGATQFAQIVFSGLPISFVYITYTTFLRGTGDSKTPLYFLLFSTFIDVVTAPIFALGWFGFPKLAVNGVALAIVLSNALALIVLLIYLKQKNHLLAADSTIFKSLKMDLKILKLLIQIGFPTGIQMILLSLSQVVVVHLINAYGVYAAAAYSAVVQIIAYVQMPAISLGMAVGILGSQLIGAKRNERLTELLKSGFWLNGIMGILLMGSAYLFSRAIVSLFLVEPETIKLAQDILYLILWSYLLFGISSVLTGIMRSSGDVFWPTVIGIFSVWGVQIPLAYLLSETVGFGLKGIWMAGPISFIFSLIVEYLYYRFRWKTRSHQNLFQES